MDIETVELDVLMKGYLHDHVNHYYQCVVCQASYYEGEVYPVDHRLLLAEKAVEHHVRNSHTNYFETLLFDEANHNRITAKQKEVMQLMYHQTNDKEMAKQLEVSTSTVRHQRFTLREKAKQAKHFLAVYNLMMAKQDHDVATTDQMVPIHAHAKMVDERYLTTEKEREQTLKTAFTSLNPLKLKQLPKKEKKKIIVLAKIIEQLDPTKRYSEIELNERLMMIFDDVATIRRYLIGYGFMERTKDGSAYWVNV